ncbi:MAG: NAD(P)/FAD-dependent oxidoreductase, partial [Thermoproteota archaeon]
MLVDALVIGAGPAGSTAAGILASRGLRVLLVDQASPGERTRCAGILGPRAWSALPHRSDDWIVGRVDWAEFVSPGGVRLRVERRGLALVVDRLAVDRGLAQWAESEGAEFLLGRASGLAGGRAVIRLSGGVEEVRFRYAVGADGPLSTVR